jgi:hypothetical protein
MNAVRDYARPASLEAALALLARPAPDSRWWQDFRRRLSWRAWQLRMQPAERPGLPGM